MNNVSQMNNVFKVNYLKETKIEKIFVFFGRRYTADSLEPFNISESKSGFKTNNESLTRLFSEDMNNRLFEGVFSEQEKQNIAKDQIEVIFSEI